VKKDFAATIHIQIPDLSSIQNKPLTLPAPLGMANKRDSGLRNQAVVISKCNNIILYVLTALYGLSEKGKARDCQQQLGGLAANKATRHLCPKIFCLSPVNTWLDHLTATFTPPTKLNQKNIFSNLY
jgi:hypothetical protein